MPFSSWDYCQYLSEYDYFVDRTRLANSFGSACVASIVRVVAFDWIDFNDITYTMVPATIWTAIEQSVGIISACLPTTRPLFGRLLRNIQHASGHDHEPQITGYATSIPLAHYSPRPAVDGSIDRARGGFSRLSDENTIDLSSATPHASQSASDDLPIVPERTVRQQKVEQHVENR